MSNRPGDWNCRSCQHLNFQRRDSCQRCGESRFGGSDYGGFATWSGSSTGFSTGSDVRPGDWYCSDCGTHNFASRSRCFKCGVYKMDDSTSADSDHVTRSRGSSSGGNHSGWKSGDWICTRWGCNEHNFASRMECFKCNAPRDFSNRTLY